MQEMPDGWERTSRREWVLDRDSLSGRACIKEVEGGFKVSVTVEDEDFGMQLLDEEEFFQPEKEAVSFLREQLASI